MKKVRWYQTMNHECDQRLNLVFTLILENSHTYEEDEYRLRAYDKNENLIAEMWNANFPYAWITQGEYFYGDGKKFRWNNSRPSKKIMNKLLCDIENKFKLQFNKTKKQHGSNNTKNNHNQKTHGTKTHYNN